LVEQVDLPINAYAAQLPARAVISKYTPMVPKTAARTASGNGARKLHVKSDAPPKTRARRSLGPKFFFMLTFLQRDKARRPKKDSKNLFRLGSGGDSFDVRRGFCGFLRSDCSLKDGASYDTIPECPTKPRLGTPNESSERPLGLGA
jgi:hypothetical protein